MSDSRDTADARERERQNAERARLSASILELLKRVPNVYQKWDYNQTHDFKKIAVNAQKLAAKGTGKIEALRETYSKLSGIYAQT